MLTISLFDAFADLGTLLLIAVAVGTMLCLPEGPGELTRGEQTLRPRRRS
jgi:hypothetical protein